ncbi:hypothetical protein D6833_06660 [Candidatus Parcubacteria bacterium]|nr:MAG: hypothetical protein D6833_06660 [Candidatus Parcubacteria bacterium]
MNHIQRHMLEQLNSDTWLLLRCEACEATVALYDDEHGAHPAGNPDVDWTLPASQAIQDGYWVCPMCGHSNKE